MMYPKIACCNFISNTKHLRQFALEYGFDGIDWSFTRENLPETPLEESSLAKVIASLYPLEIRYHCAFKKTDIGHADAPEAKEAIKVFRSVIRLVSRLRGSSLTIHVGLGRDSTSILSWDRTIESLKDMVIFAGNRGVRLCLENLAWGWTSRPELFEKLIRKTGCWATLDIGHARVSQAVACQQFKFEDFALPHPERFLSAHIYHEERENKHYPPDGLGDIEDRVHFLKELPLCDWWVLELREEKPLLKTLGVMKQFFYCYDNNLIHRYGTHASKSL